MTSLLARLPAPRLVVALSVGGLAGVLAGMVHPLAPAVLALGALVSGFGLMRPLALLVCFLGILFLRPADFFPALAPLQVGKLAALGAFGAMALERMIRRDLRWPSVAHNRWLLALIGAVLLSSLRGSDPGQSMAVFREVFVKIIFIYVLLLMLVDTPRRALGVQVGITLFTAVLGLYAIKLKVTGMATIEGSRAGAVGLLGDPNDLALTLLLAPAFLLTVYGRVRGGLRLWVVAALFAVLGGIVATQSRGGLLGLGALLYVWMRGRIRSRAVVLALTGVGLAGMLVVAGVAQRKTVSTSGIDESAQGRLDAWYAGYRMFRARPLTGVGFERFPDNYSVYAVRAVEWGPKAAHSSYVKALAETGLFGIIPFLGLLWVSVRAAWRVRQPTGPPTAASAVPESMLPTLVGFLVSAAFLSQTWNWFLYILIGLTAALTRIQQGQGAAGSGPAIRTGSR